MAERREHSKRGSGPPGRVPGTLVVILLVAVGLGWLGWHALTGAWLEGRGGRVEPLPWPDMRVDLNAATAAQLSVLPGIGPELSVRIVADREANGAFTSVGQLQRVDGVGPATVERIEPYVVVSAGEPAE